MPQFATQGRFPLFVTFETDVVPDDTPVLRGCIGCLSPIELSELRHYAHSAAFLDDRFAPMALSDLAPERGSTLFCKVSLLHGYEQARSVFDFELGTHGIIIDFDLHRAWARDLFAPVLSWLGCTGCGSSQKGQRSQPRWCTHIMSHINFCDQVRLSPYLNLYGNEAMARSITASRASLRTSRSSHGQWRTGGAKRTASKGQGEKSSLAKSADAVNAALSMSRIARAIQQPAIIELKERAVKRS